MTRVLTAASGGSSHQALTVLPVELPLPAEHLPIEYEAGACVRYRTEQS